MKKEIKILLLTYFLLIFIKSILVYFVPAPTAFADSYTYAKIARDFFYFGSLSIQGAPLYSFPPLYSIILSISYVFSDMNIVYFFMKFINVIISSLVIFPAYLLAKEFLNKNKSILIAILISVFPSNFSFSPYLMAENLFYPLFLFSLYFMYRSFLEKDYKYDILTGIFVGLSMLTKPVGLVLLFILVGVSFFYFLKYKKFKEIFLKKGVLILFLFLTYSIWLIRNFILFGFNFLSIGRDYAREASYFGGQLSWNFLSWIFLYLGYIILASGIIFFIFSIPFYKKVLTNKRFFLFSLISLFSLLSVILVAANHNIFGNQYFLWLVGRPLGRYVDFILPLMFVSGFVELENYFKHKFSLKTSLLFVGSILLFSSLILFYPLFPVNNSSVIWLGGLSYIIRFISFGSLEYSLLFNFKFLILSIILLFLLLSFVYIILKKLNLRILYFLLFIFFLLSSLLVYGFVYYDSYTNWYYNGHNEVGLWFNSCDRQISNILFDERDYGKIFSGKIINLETGKEGIYEKPYPSLTNTSNGLNSIMGFWMNDNLYVGNVNNLKNIDYVVSMHKLDLNLVKRSKNDIFIYSTNKNGNYESCSNNSSL